MLSSTTVDRQCLPGAFQIGREKKEEKGESEEESAERSSRSGCSFQNRKFLIVRHASSLALKRFRRRNEWVFV